MLLVFKHSESKTTNIYSGGNCLVKVTGVTGVTGATCNSDVTGVSGVTGVQTQ